MDAIFLKLLNMSITASWLILAVIVLRLVLKKAPKWTHCALWGLVGLRLLFPFSIESALSLIPSADTVNADILFAQEPAIDIGIPAINSTVNPVISGSFAPTVGASVNPLQIWTTVAAYVWFAGIAAMLIYTVITYIRLRRKVDTAVLLLDNIWQSENVKSPFILGLLRPRIYLPFNMTDEDMTNVLAHENTHLKHCDHLIKPLAFLLLTVYWFNPLIWLACVLLCRDIELACDEHVVKDLGEQERRDYGAALFSCSVSRKSIAACPLAFGEIGVKVRIKTVLNYKKPAFWIIIVAVTACIVVAVCFLTNPRTEYTPQDGDVQGIGVRLKTEVSAESESITVRWENSTPYEAVYGDAYDIERLENGEWISCAVNEINFYMPAYSLRPRSSAEKEYSLANYNLTQAGQYRFTARCHFSKNVPITEEESFMVWAAFIIDEKSLSLNDVIMLSGKGEELTWSDFDGYAYTDVGSGLYIRVYEVNPQYSLWIGGGSTNVSPMYIRLVSATNTDDYIDIRTESVTDFIEANHFDKVPVTFGSADLDRDGKAESFEVSESASGVYLLKVLCEDGSVLWSEEAATAHAGWNGLYLYRGEDGFYILRYNPTMYQGEADYHYELFTLDGGKVQTVASRFVSFSVNPDNLPTAKKRAEMDSFAAEVNALLEKSTVLLSTAKGGELFLGGVSAESFLEDFAVLDEMSDPLTAAFTVTSGGETITPYQNHLWAQTWDDGNWLSADAISVLHKLPEIAGDLPELTIGNDFQLNLGEAESFRYLSVFDEAYERIYHNVALDMINELPAGAYYVSFVVSEQGRYIAEAEDYEASGYEYVFKLIVT